MTDILRLQEQAARGARYIAAIQSGEVMEALDHIESQYAEEWANTHDPDARENLWRAVQVVRKIKSHFGQMAGDSKMASHHLAELKRLGK